jgi:shikimate kinase
MNLILFGFKGVGKTFYGRKLAHLMHRPFIDTDDLSEELYAEEKGERLTSKQIFQELGAVPFRALEKQAVFSLGKIKNSVIALGGGAIVDPDNLEFLQKLGALVYLKASPETLRLRMQKAIDKGETPAIVDPKQLETTFWRLIQERLPLYESIQCDTIDTDQLDDAGVLAALRSILVLTDPPNGF